MSSRCSQGDRHRGKALQIASRVFCGRDGLIEFKELRRVCLVGAWRWLRGAPELSAGRGGAVGKEKREYSQPDLPLPACCSVQCRLERKRGARRAERIQGEFFWMGEV